MDKVVWYVHIIPIEEGVGEGAESCRGKRGSEEADKVTIELGVTGILRRFGEGLIEPFQGPPKRRQLLLRFYILSPFHSVTFQIQSLEFG